MNELLYRGTTQPRPTDHHLQAGPLSMLYENGFIRYLKLGDEEVLRMIYFALRDENWATMELRLSNERIETNSHSFSIRYTCCHFHGDTEIIRWQCQLTGTETGQIDFSVDGEVLTPFRRNRAGFCVLHPVKEAVGQPVVIDHPGGSQTESAFPRLISPHQPFVDMAAMQWTLPGGSEAMLTFSGDIFETEDQRNWTDASFKTYCTPLHLPRPVQLHPGDRIRQAVTLQLTRLVKLLVQPPVSPQVVTIHRTNLSAHRLPAIGLSQAVDQPKLKADEVEQLRKLAPDHLRIEVDFRRGDWSEWLAVGLGEARKLQTKVLLAVLFTNEYASEFEQLQQAIEWLGVQPWAVEVFSSTHQSTPDTLLNAVVEPLRRLLPNAVIGAGAYHLFTDLNRNRSGTDALDYVVYAVNPQIHAFDDRTLVENIQAQADTVVSAQDFAGGKPIHVGPITLRPRQDVKAGSEMELPADADHRQPSLFAAGWLLGSLTVLSGVGAGRVTYFETKGHKGVIRGIDEPASTDWFDSQPVQVFPAGLLLQALADWKDADCLPVRSSDSLKVSALWLRKESRELLVLANHTWEEQTVEMPENAALFDEVWFLDETTAPQAIQSGELPAGQPFSGETVVLKPFALAALSKKQA